MNDFNGGTQFDFTYAPGISQEQILGFEMAGEIWSSYLNDDVTVRIHVESTSELPDEVVGAALPGKKKTEKYDQVREALSLDATSSEDRLAFSNLSWDDKEFSVLINGQELDKTKEFRLTNANAKALGLLRDDRNQLDGYIMVNDLSGNEAVGWDYDALRSGDASETEIDFLSVAMHEIGHVLGFVSGIDDGDWLNVLTKAQAEGKEIKDKDFKFASTLDLYRYSDSNPSEGLIDLSIGGNPYFSIDGGNTSLGNFANGQYTEFGGDGYQASHWQQYSSQGIMNPVLPNGERRDLSSTDLTAIDVVGWDVNRTAPDMEGMYANAAANAETANVQDRSKEIEKLVKDSGYDIIRRSRRSSRPRYFRQEGYWQFSTLAPVDAPEVVGEAEVTPEAEAEIDPDGAEPIPGEPALEAEVVDTVANDPNLDNVAESTEQIESGTTAENSPEDVAVATMEDNDGSDTQENEELVTTDEPILETEPDNSNNTNNVQPESGTTVAVENSNPTFDTDEAVSNEPVAEDEHESETIETSPVDNLPKVQAEANQNSDDQLNNLEVDSKIVAENENIVSADNSEVSSEVVSSDEENDLLDSDGSDLSDVVESNLFIDLEDSDDNDDSDDEELENGIFYNYILDDRYVTGVANSDRDSLFVA